MDRDHRLRKGQEFDRTYREGTVFSGPLLVLRVAPNGLGRTRWGFAVGKRISKKAVDRNRVRRRLRELARTLAVAEGYDVVVTARNGALEASSLQLGKGLARIVARSPLQGEARRA
ncbi:MAG TPA: ribonuclease P protein component [Tepidiformaceae bacterium]|nr:ribonuclease P protein component [Tepidiformaceae bacterium]